MQDKTVLITGANGGIGSELARSLAAEKANLILLARNPHSLHVLADELSSISPGVQTYTVDLLDRPALTSVLQEIKAGPRPVDVLVNTAGMLSYSPFVEEDPQELERMFQLNVLTPMFLTRALLPGMLERGSGKIVNIGSTFGSIGFAYFSGYASTKFALRGFSESLRRELEGSGVDVSYIAPRAVATKFNSDAVYEMAEQTKMNMDTPEWVAEQVMKAIKNDLKDCYLGFPEKLFVRLNAILPRLVDRALSKQKDVLAHFARKRNALDANTAS